MPSSTHPAMPNLTGAEWFKSSYSEGGNGQCIEAAANIPGVVPVRDSKDPERTPLVFPRGSFTSFVTAVARGDFGI